MNWITKFILVACTALAIAGTKALAHVGYSGRDFGNLMYNSDGSGKTVTISSGFGWADATDADWGDSHRGRFFRFTLSGSGDVQITAQRNDLLGTFLPAFSLYSGLGQLSPEQGGHDGSELSIDNRPVGTEGSLRALGNWSIGNDDTYNTGGPTSGVLYAARLAYFTYIGHAADGNFANFGNAAGIVGDGTPDGFVTATFSGLAAGDYSLFVGGANYVLQNTEAATYPTYGVNVTVGLVPEPSASSLLLGSAALLGLLRRRRG